jgi:hypothetical protein
MRWALEVVMGWIAVADVRFRTHSTRAWMQRPLGKLSPTSMISTPPMSVSFQVQTSILTEAYWDLQAIDFDKLVECLEDLKAG